MDRSRKLRRIRLRDLSHRPLLAAFAPGRGAPGALSNGVDNVDEAEVRCWRDYSGTSSRPGIPGEAFYTPQVAPSPPEVIPLSGTLSGGGGDGRAFLGSSASEYLKMTQVQVWG